MASLLYRLGHFSARRPWVVILVWLLLLGGVGGAAAALQRPLSNTMTIDGLQFQQTLDALKRELPAASGGTGTAVFRAKDGHFTPQQKAAVAKAVAEWKTMPAVSDAVDPFVVQQSLDDGQRKVVEGEQQLATNDKKLTDGQAQLDAGRKRIDQETAKLTDGKSELTRALQQLADGDAKLEAGKAKVAHGRAELTAGERRLRSGKADLARGRRKLAEGRAQVAEGKRKLAAGQAKLDAGRRQIAAAQAKLDDGAAALAAGRTKVEAGEAKLADAKSQLSAGEAKLADAKAQVAAGEDKVTAAKAQVAEAEQQRAALRAKLTDPSFPPDQETTVQAQIDQLTAGIDAGNAQITSGEAKVAAAKEQIAAKSPELDAAREQIAAKEPQVRAARSTLDAKSAELAAGRRTLRAKKAELARGQATLDSKAALIDGSEAQLAAAQRKVRAGQRQIAAAQAKVDRGERALAGAEEQIRVNEERLAAGRRKAEAGQIRISQGEAQLIAARDKLKASQAQITGGKSKIAEARAQLAVGKRQAALTKGMRFVSEDGSTAMTQIRFHDEIHKVEPADRKKVVALRDQLATAGIDATFGSELTQDVSSIMGPGEIIGLAIAAVVLLVMLGTLVAAGLPLLMAMGGVAVGLGAAMAATHWVELTSTTPALGLMIGMAVGIDYALFIVNRHREQLKTGMPRLESIALAVGTAGNAVGFAGTTVIIALAALLVTGIGFLGAMGVTAAGTVACAVLINLTLLPALVSLAGHRVLPRRVWRAHGFTRRGIPVSDSHPHDPEKVDSGWGAAVTRRPVLAILAGLVVVAILGFPAAGLRLGLPDGGSEPPQSQAYRTYETIGQKFGAGANGPIVAVATLPGGLDATQATDKQLDVAERLTQVHGLMRVVPIGLSKDRRTAAYQAVPEGGPADQATVDTVQQIRDEAGQIKQQTGADVQVTGQTVANIDVSAKLASALPAYLAIVVGLSLVLLLMVFRSVVVPFIATGGFLLSLAAAFGGVVAVYQHGFLGSVFGVHHPSAILSFLPILLIGVLFGLAMDYQMFLVSGMREAHVHGDDARRAVRVGFSHAAAVVTAAAIIMVSVFAGFIHAELTMIRPIGFGLALGVLVDAFLVRMTLTPAIMHLLGERAWWMPRWLDRIVPDVDVEGVKLVDRVAHARPVEPTPETVTH